SASRPDGVPLAWRAGPPPCHAPHRLPRLPPAIRSLILARCDDASSLLAYRRSKRYISAMATIQIRNVPERVHRIYQARAAAAGMSLQEFMLAELISGAQLRTPADIAIEVEQRLHGEGTEGFSVVSSADIIAADRESR